jgi:hypothetical protein
MDFGDIGENIPIIAIIIGLILLQFFLRRRRAPATTQQGIVQNLLAEVRLDLKLTEVFNFSQQARKFMTTSWQLHKSKLDFLDQSLQSTLSDAFTMAEDFNQQIAAAKKYKSTSYLASIDVDKLKDKLTKSREGLEEWLLSKVETKEPSPKYPGIFDDWTGKG